MQTYTERNPEFRKSVAALLKCDSSLVEQLNISMSSPVELRSVVIVEIYPVPTLQMILCIYSHDRELQDVISFRGNRFFRVHRSGDNLRHIDRINSQILEALSSCEPIEVEEGREEDDSRREDDARKLQIQQLRDRSKVDRNTIQSLRTQIRLLRQRQK